MDWNILKNEIKEDGVVEISEKDGVRTRLSEAILLPESQLVASIFYLPNKKKEFVLLNAGAVKLINGWMLAGYTQYEGFKSVQEDKGQLLELITGSEGLSPGVYRFIKDENGFVTGLKKIMLIQ